MTTANMLLSLGFDSVELGTFTLHQQPGKDHPRLLAAYPMLANSMGFPNPGIKAIIEDMGSHPPIGKVGISVSGRDATAAIPMLDELPVDYVVVNVSSPNTPGLKSIPLRDVVISSRKPLYLKVNPEQVGEAVWARPDGLILCNTDKGRSGPFLLDRAARAVAAARRLSSSLYIIGCGGVWSRSDAAKLLDAGANTVQLLTAWIYRGLAVLQ
jgi:dihydroorotate dehydrogenase